MRTLTSPRPAGTIGAGKTSLVAWLVKRYGVVPFYEPNEQEPVSGGLLRRHGALGVPLAGVLSRPQAQAPPGARRVRPPRRHRPHHLRGRRDLRAEPPGAGLPLEARLDGLPQALRGHLPQPAAAGRAHRADVPPVDRKEAHRAARARDGAGDPGRVPAAAAQALRAVVRHVRPRRPSCGSTRARSTTWRTSWTSSS